MFRNLRFYRLDGKWPADEQALSEALDSAAFKPCGPLTERSSGFEAVFPDESESLARRVNGADLFRLRTQSRILPHAAVNEELEARVEEYRERMGEAPSAREKRRMKAEVRDNLLPKSMVKSDRTWAYFDLKEQVLGIDAAQETAAERCLRRLQAAVPDATFKPLGFEQPVNDLLQKVFLGGGPIEFEVGRECKMCDAADAGSAVRWTNFDLADRSIRDHVANGMRLTHLGIVYDNIASFVLDENGVITKIKFLGVGEDEQDAEEPLARLDTEFVLVSGTLRKMLGELRKVLGSFD